MAEHSTHSHSRSLSHTTHSRFRRRRSSDLKAYRKSRYFCAFLLFITLTLLSFSATAKAYPLDADRVGDIFTSREYVTALADDVRTYGEDMCRRNGVPVSALGDLLSDASIRAVNESYVYGTLSLDEKYSKTYYADKLDELSASLEKNIDKTLQTAHIKTADGVRDGAAALSQDITDYLEKRMVFPLMEKVETVLSLGATAAVTVTVISAVLTTALILVVIALGSEVYRNLRSVTHAFSAAALMCFGTAVLYGIIREEKELFFFPEYLEAALMRYLDASAGALALTGALLTVASFAVMAVTWKLKSDKLDSSSSHKASSL